MKLFLNGGGDGEKCLKAYKKLNEIIDHKKPILYVPIAIEEEKYGDCEKWINNELKEIKIPYIEMITSGQELANKNLDTYSALFIGGGNTGLNISTFCLANWARRRRRISSSVLPENIEPHTTSILPGRCASPVAG